MCVDLHTIADDFCHNTTSHHSAQSLSNYTALSGCSAIYFIIIPTCHVIHYPIIPGCHANYYTAISARDTSHCAVISACLAVSDTVISTSHYTTLSVSYTTYHTAMSSSHTTHYTITPANSTGNIYETATHIICHTIVSPTFTHHTVSSLYQTTAVNLSMPDNKFSGHATPTPLCTKFTVTYTPRANINTTITTVFIRPSDTCINITNTCKPNKITITESPFIYLPCICIKLRNINNHINLPVTCSSNGNASISNTSITIDYSNTHLPTPNTAVPHIHLSVTYSNLPETKFNHSGKYNDITVPWCTCP